MSTWDLSTLTGTLYKREEGLWNRSSPLSRPPLSSCTRVAFLHKETGRTPLRPESGGEDSTSNLSAAREQVGDSENSRDTDSAADWQVRENVGTPLCRPARRRDVCLLRCDPWSGTLVSLAAEGSRLTLRAATLDSAAFFPEGCARRGQRGPELRASGSHCTDVGVSFSQRCGHRTGRAGAPVVDVDESEHDDGEAVHVEAEEEEKEGLPFRHVFSTQWRLPTSTVSDVLLTSSPGIDGDAEPASPLFRVVAGCCGEPTAVALSAQQLFQINLPGLTCSPSLSVPPLSLPHAPTPGIALGAARCISFDQPLSVSATAMDAYGPHCTLVGFSNGQLNVYDWREKTSHHTGATSDAATVARPALTLAAVPQPLWLLPKGTAAARRRRLALGESLGQGGVGDGATSAGILSCCTVAESWRVVCSLADARGAVVVADLRKGTCVSHPSGLFSSTSSASSSAADGHGGVTAATQSFYGATLPTLEHVLTRKRSRLTPTEIAVKTLIDGHAAAVTGRSITAMQHCAERFGLIGMVDLQGTPILTSLAALEGRGVAASTGLDALFDDGEEGSSPGMRCRVEPSSAQRPSGSGADLPSPSDVFRRIQSGRRSAAAAAPPRARVSEAPPPARPSLGNRCAFANGGSSFVFSYMDRANVSAASFLTTGLGARSTACHGSSSDGQTLRVQPHLHNAAPPDAYSVTSLSTLDNVVCLDTAGGHSICVVLEA